MHLKFEFELLSHFTKETQMIVHFPKSSIYSYPPPTSKITSLVDYEVIHLHEETRHLELTRKFFYILLSSTPVPWTRDPGYHDWASEWRTGSLLWTSSKQFMRLATINSRLVSSLFWVECPPDLEILGVGGGCLGSLHSWPVIWFPTVRPKQASAGPVHKNSSWKTLRMRLRGRLEPVGWENLRLW